MVVTTYFHKLVARLLLPCDKVVAWLLQPRHFYMGTLPFCAFDIRTSWPCMAPCVIFFIGHLYLRNVLMKVFNMKMSG